MRTRNPELQVKKDIAAAASKSYESCAMTTLRSTRDYSDRVQLNLGSPPTALPTNERLKKFQQEDDPSLVALYFQFGRYLLMSSSRPGCMPANLQGIWNDQTIPSWGSKYTTNINLEMNYWPAEVTNLSECAEPLFSLIANLVEPGTRVAKVNYGAGGWVLHQNTDLWLACAPMDGPTWGTFATGGAWLCTHLWENYLFNQDPGTTETVLSSDEGFRSILPRYFGRASNIEVDSDLPIDVPGTLSLDTSTKRSLLG